MKTNLSLRAGQLSAFLERYSWGLGAIFFVVAIITMSSSRGPVAMTFWILALLCFWWPALVKMKHEFLAARPKPSEARDRPSAGRPDRDPKSAI